jgi:hypothetical protein
VTTEAVVPAPVAADAPAWSPLTRIGFRIAFFYFVSFALLCGNGTIFNVFPVVGGWIYNALMWAPNKLTPWVGIHLFHLTGIAAHRHSTGSGDTAQDWVMNGLYVAVALAGGLLWTLLAALRGNRRGDYTSLHAWLRFLLRLTCGMFMLDYGFAKVFPLQMPPLSVGILNEPVGNMSPMTMLWGLIAIQPVYQVICGCAEVIGGVLILFRRTALLGALVSAFVVTNVLLFNLFFDVPVKLFAANLLLACLFLAVPDLRSLFDFFWLHKPATAHATWVPALSRRWARITLRIVEIVFTFAFLTLIPWFTGQAWRQTEIARHTSSPLLGSWRLDSAHPATGAFITGDGAPATDLYVDNVSHAYTRSVDGELWRTSLHLDARAHTVTIYPYGLRGITTYSWEMPDANHLVLTTVPPETPSPQGKSPAKPAPPFTPQTVSLTRTPTAAHYFLLKRGFHFVNEWGYER